ncbi:MAG: DUF1599 domain-containing protein [Ginsengibacter sp.]
MQDNTNQEYDSAIAGCRGIFIQKTKDYGTSWRVYRAISIADQIYIKARRIRNIQENRVQKIEDDILDEFKGILNYAVIGLIQSEINNDEMEDMDVALVEKMYDEKISMSKKLMEDKNHDYDEAWRDMSQQSFADLILAKVLRIKKIISNDNKTLISEGIEANLFDIINYSAFALILSAKQNV